MLCLMLVTSYFLVAALGSVDSRITTTSMSGSVSWCLSLGITSEAVVFSVLGVCTGEFMLSDPSVVLSVAAASCVAIHSIASLAVAISLCYLMLASLVSG